MTDQHDTVKGTTNKKQSNKRGSVWCEKQARATHNYNLQSMIGGRRQSDLELEQCVGTSGCTFLDPVTAPPPPGPPINH